jgi:hypothetical protein
MLYRGGKERFRVDLWEEVKSAEGSLLVKEVGMEKFGPTLGASSRRRHGRGPMG